MNMKIAIATHKKDFWFCRICVASIRYYYPNIEISIIKDELNGRFNTTELEKYYQVKVVSLSQKKFGCGTAKVFFLLEAPKEEKYLLIDSDIVFIGPFLERLYQKAQDNDILVSAGFREEPIEKESWLNKMYFDLDTVKQYDFEYTYPGYFFNGGHYFITGGCVNKEDMQGLFDLHNYPYYIKTDVLPAADQSLFNYLFRKLQLKEQLTLATDGFVYWSEDKPLSKIPFEDIVEKRVQGGLIHWAGALRTPLLEQMTRNDVLIFFENYYYSKLPFGKLKQLGRKIIALYREGVSKLFQKK